MNMDSKFNIIIAKNPTRFKYSTNYNHKKSASGIYRREKYP
jgi:hypothetical protein